MFEDPISNSLSPLALACSARSNDRMAASLQANDLARMVVQEYDPKHQLYTVAKLFSVFQPREFVNEVYWDKLPDGSYVHAFEPSSAIVEYGGLKTSR